MPRRFVLRAAPRRSGWLALSLIAVLPVPCQRCHGARPTTPLSGPPMSLPKTPMHIPFETITLNTVFSGGTLLALFYFVMAKVGPWRKQTTEATDKLIEQLTGRLEKVERDREADRRMHYIQVARIEARHAAQRSLDRHKFNNSEACLDALLIRLEAGQPVAEAVRLVQEMRHRQRDAERGEAATIHAAEIAAVERAEKELEDADQD